MNWSRVRWLLIVCLCLADLVLGVLLWRDYRGENTVSHAAIEDAAALLAEVNVTLPPEVVPTAVIRDYVYRVPVPRGVFRNDRCGGVRRLSSAGVLGNVAAF